MGVLLLAPFVAWERRSAAPMIDLALFGRPRFLWGSVAATVASFACSGCCSGCPSTSRPSMDAVLGELPVERSGSGTALTMALRQVGGALGVALLGSAPARPRHHDAASGRIGP